MWFFFFFLSFFLFFALIFIFITQLTAKMYKHLIILSFLIWIYAWIILSVHILKPSIKNVMYFKKYNLLLYFFYSEKGSGCSNGNGVGQSQRGSLAAGEGWGRKYQSGRWRAWTSTQPSVIYSFDISTYISKNNNHFSF